VGDAHPVLETVAPYSANSKIAIDAWLCQRDRRETSRYTVAHGLSYLNVWWMRLDIVHQRIHPGWPQENGAHERMHRTLKRSAVRPVQRTCGAQQKQSEAFRLEYNTERPHEALGQETPASRYRSFPRSYPSQLPVPEIPGTLPRQTRD
jgi:transposase InsO family protein